MKQVKQSAHLYYLR